MRIFNPMEIGDYEELFNKTEHLKVYEAEYLNDTSLSFRIVFSFDSTVDMFLNILNSKERYDFVKKEFGNDIELKDFEPVLVLYYSPLVDSCDNDNKEISLNLSFMHSDGSEWGDYTHLFDDEDMLKIDFFDDENDNFCRLANFLFLIKTKMTCYEAMLEDEWFDLLDCEINDIHQVRRLQRMSRQVLDEYRIVTIKQLLIK